MAKQANILSFDDAKRHDARRRSASGSARSSAMSSSSSRRSRSASRVESDEFASRVVRARRASTGSTSSRSSALSSWLDDGAAASIRNSRHGSGTRASRASRSTGRAAIQSYDDFLAEDEFEGEERGEHGRGRSDSKKKSLLTQLSDARRKRAKEKAGKAFTRQFGDDSRGAAEAGPRAAVYKGEMGASQRRAARMQEGRSGSGAGRSRNRAAMAAARNGRVDSRAGAPAGKHARGGISAAVAALPRLPFALPSISLPHLSLSGIVGALFATRARVVAFSTVCCLVIACAFMYPAAKDYYTELRHYEKVQAEYEAVVARNAQLSDTVTYLNSVDGIEANAHEKYGWVNEGENSVLVYGLPESDAIAEINPYIKTGSVDAPETWYSVILDPFFGVE